jgi:hypothetical protein
VDELAVITAIVGDVAEAEEILEEAYDVWRWREHPWQSPFRLARLLAEHHVQQRNRVGLIRRYRNDL